MICLDGVGFKRGGFELAGVDLKIGEGEYGVLTGKTGSGKSSLLEVLVGLVEVEAGRVLIGGEDVTGSEARLRGIGYVPQDGGLFGRMLIEDQLGFALRVRGVGKKELRERVDEIAGYLGIGHLLGRGGLGLSGGEISRVAIGRALIFEPRVLLLDEPLSALDEGSREILQEMLFGVCRDRGVSVLHVTHWPGVLRDRADVFYRIASGQVIRE